MKANLVDLSDLVMLNPTTTSSRFSQQHLLVSHDVIFSFVVDFPIPLMLLISPLNMLFIARDVTQCFATIDDVSREMRLEDGDRCC